MLRTVTALAVCVAATAGTRAACESDEMVSLCLQFGDDWMGSSVTECLAGETPTTTSGAGVSSKLVLAFRAVGLDQTLLSAEPQIASLECESNVAVFHLTSAMSPSLIGLGDFISTVDMDAELRVSQTASGGLALEWKGDLVTGSIDAIFVEFAVKKETFDGELVASVGVMPPASATSPNLPPILEFVGSPMDLLNAAQSCPLTAVVPQGNGSTSFVPSLGIPESEEPIAVVDAFFDPCLALRLSQRNCSLETCEDELVLSLNASLANDSAGRTIEFGGVELKDLWVSVDAMFVWSGEETDDSTGTDEDVEAGNSLAWEGKAGARVNLFEKVEAAVNASFSSENGIEDVKVELALETDAVVVRGTLDWGSECMSAAALAAVSGAASGTSNEGSVKVTFPALNASVEGVAKQVSCEEWAVTGDLMSDSFTLFDVEVTKVAAELSLVDGQVSGSVSGGVSIASMVNASAELAVVNGTLGSMTLAGAVDVESVLTGSVEFTVTTAAVMSGNGSVALTFGNGELAVSAELEYTKGASAENATVWSVRAAVDSWTLFGVKIENVTADVQAVIGDEHQLVWSGDVTGQVTFGSVGTVDVRVAVADNSFQSIKGKLQLAHGGVQFDGEFELDETTAEAGCSGLSYGAEGTVKAGKYVFDGTLDVDGCAQAGEVAYKVAAAMDPTATAKFGKLALTRASIVLRGSSDGQNGVESWDGTLTANANLFGGTSKVSVSFADGAFGETYVTTQFRTPSQLLSGALNFHYTPNCALFSEGTADVRVRIADTQTLNVSGTLQFNTCTGELHFNGEHKGEWQAPGSPVVMQQVYLKLSVEANSSEASSGVGKRHWTGTLKASADIGSFDGSLAILIDTKTTSTSVVSELTYEDEHLFIGAGVSYNSTGPCTGEGTVIVQNLPNGLPSVESEVVVEFAECSDPSAGWSVRGSVDDLVLPFASKTVAVNEATVEVSKQDASSGITVDVRGIFADYFFVAVQFNTSDADSVRVVGGVSDGNPSVADFVSGWAGSSGSLPASLGEGSPELFADIKNFTLGAAVFEFDYGAKRVTLEAKGTLYGVDFYALVAVTKPSSGSGWLYGVLLTASDLASFETSGLAGVLRNVVEKVEPSGVSFSLSSFATPSEGLVVTSLIDGQQKVIRRGLTLAAYLGSDNELLKQVSTMAPDELNTQVQEKKDGLGGITLIANVESPTDLDVFAMLHGDLNLGSDRLKLKTLALCLRVSATGPPAVGFLTSVWFKLGKKPNTKEFTTSGFVSLSAAGTLAIAFDVTSPEPWEKPFGVAGVSVEFPLGLKFGVNVATMVPTNFALVGGVEVAGASGELQLGADLENLGNTAFSTEVTDMNMKRMIVQMTKCDACVAGVGGTLATMSVERVAANINPDPANAVTIRLASTSVTIDAGILVSVENLNLWNIIKIDEASFSLTAKGLEATLEAQPVKWGPISITAMSDETKGPNFDLALTTDKQQLTIDGKAQILGLSAGVYLKISDTENAGRFEVALGNHMSLAGDIEVTGTPLSSNFQNKINGVLSVDVDKAIDEATAWLQTLEEDAKAKFESAKKAMDKVKSKLSSTQGSLDRLNSKWMSTIDGWQRKVNSLQSKINSLNKKCKKYKKKCKKFPWTGCFQWGLCKIEVGAVWGAKGVANVGLEGVRVGARIAIAAAKSAVWVAQTAVDGADYTLGVAEKLFTGFVDLATSAGGLLKNVIQINHIGFTSELTTSSARVAFTGDIRVLGKAISWNFEHEIVFAQLISSIVTKLRSVLKGLWGSRISSL